MDRTKRRYRLRPGPRLAKTKNSGLLAKQTPAKFGWLSLPVELRMMVFDVLRQSARPNAHEKSAWATVSAEWQQYFEKTNFMRLILHQDDLVRFQKIVNKRRRQFVTWIWLRMELDTYGCTKCSSPHSRTQIGNENRRLTNAIHNLFRILSKWEKDRYSKTHKAGVTLELSAHSPSDAEHAFQPLQIRMNDTAWALKSAKTMRSKSYSEHRWQLQGPNNVFLLRDGTSSRLLGPSEGMCLRQRSYDLPKVSIVTCFVIRRQFYRHFSVLQTLKPIINALPHLSAFRYEPWRAITNFRGAAYGLHWPDIREKQNLSLFAEVLQANQNLKMVSFYENVDWYIHRLYSINEPNISGIGRAAAESTRNLEQFYGAIGIDARDFFYGFYPKDPPKPDLQWPLLKSISLTSRSLIPEHADQLILAAAAAARRMPNLIRMELWNANLESATVFLYAKRDHRQVIELSSSWRGHFSQGAIRSWREVAQERANFRYLQISFREIPEGIIKQHDQLLPWLTMRSSMLTPGSLAQIYREIGMFEEAQL